MRVVNRMNINILICYIYNKVVKPHSGPSAVLVFNATGHYIVQDANSFSGFGLNGIPTGYNCLFRVPRLNLKSDYLDKNYLGQRIIQVKFLEISKSNFLGQMIQQNVIL